MKIQLKILDHTFYSSNRIDMCPEGYHDYLPSYATQGSAALDLVATKDYTIYPGERVMIGTGLAIWIGSSSLEDRPPWSYFYDNNSVAGFIIPRSGLGTKGLVLANTIGLIDQDYQGELKISAWNSNERMWKLEHETNNVTDISGHTKIEIKAGDRIAQMYFAPVIKAQWDIVEEFTDSTERGAGGFNSTGV